MKTKSKLILELKKLNQKLDRINTQSKYMVYQAKPFKFAFYNFIAGTFFALGSLFGTAIIAALIAYIVSRLDFIAPISNWIEQILSQVNWDSIIAPTATPSAIPNL